MNPTSESKAGFRPEIHALRALAVLLVVLFHVRQTGFAGGFVGVDVFFVISGFLITGSLAGEAMKSGTIAFAAFYARRARRLLPASALVILTTIVVAHFLLSPLAQVELVRSAVSSSTYASNIYFAFKSLDYLAGGVQVDPFLHTWSLSLEEQFYLFWPLLIFLAAKLGCPKDASSKRSRILVAMAIVALVSFVGSLLMLPHSQPWAFFGAPFRAWEFAAGGLARLLEDLFADRPRLSRTLSATGIVAILVAGIQYKESTVFPGLAALLPVAGAMFVVGTGKGIGSWRRFLDNRLFRWLGDLSYPWYLWHWPFLVLPALAWGEQPLPVRIVLGLGSLAAAEGTYRWFENPIRFNPRFSKSVRWSLLLGVILPVISVSTALAVHLGAKRALATPPQDKVWLARTVLPPVYADGCSIPFAGDKAGPCVYGDPGSDSTVFLIGDSHAAVWHAPLDSICKARKYRLVSLTKSACPPALFVPWAPVFHRAFQECQVWHEFVLSRIGKEHPFLVVAGSGQEYWTDSLGGMDTARWEVGWRSLLDTLSRGGSRVVVIQDAPPPKQDIPACLSAAFWHGKSSSACDFPPPSPGDAIRTKLGQMKGPNVSVIDLSSHICGTRNCRSVVDGLPAYSDDGHLSTRFTSAIGPHLDSAIFRMTLPPPAR